MTTTKKPKRRRKTKPVNESYLIAIDDFEVDYHFGINSVGGGIVEGDFWEGSTLNLIGRILSPPLKNATKAVIAVCATPELNGHWKEPPRETIQFGYSKG